MNRYANTPDGSGLVQALGPRDLMIAATVGKYRLLGALGHGGMADVYLAVADGPEGFRKLCVVKMLKEEMAGDEDFRMMFIDEARLAARLNHPNIVQTYEVEDSSGGLLLAMEYVEGQPMTRIRRRASPEAFPLTATVRVLCDVLDALDYAHKLTDFDGRNLWIVHRDVSPHNIIVGYDGRVKLVDFGIAKSAAAVQMTQVGVLKGKVGYMAPEQARLGSVDGRADLFSVGVILWEAIAGRRLADGQTAREVLARRMEGSEPRIATVVPDVDPELARICNLAMSPRPEDRYPDAASFQADLEAWLKGQPETPRKVWAAALHKAFEPERHQLRIHVEQRLSENGAATRITGLSTTTGQSPVSVRSISTEPESAPPLPAPPPPNGKTTSSSSESQSFSGRTVTVEPGTSKSRVPVVALVALIVGLGLASAGVALRRGTPSTQPAAELSPPVVGATPPPSSAPHVAVVPSSSVAPPVASVATSSSAVVGAPRRPPGPFGGGGFPLPHGPGAVPPPPEASAGKPLTPNKPAARPLDEKDPYAP